MVNNPMSLKFQDDVFKELERLHQETNLPVTRLVNMQLRESFRALDLADIQDMFELNDVVRLRHTNTSQSAAFICKLFKSKELMKIVFASKACNLNGFKLVILFEFKTFSVLADNVDNNIARYPRTMEVVDIFKEWKHQGLQDKSFMIGSVIDDTANQQPEKSYDCIKSNQIAPFRYREYLQLIGLKDHNEHVDEYQQLLSVGGA